EGLERTEDVIERDRFHEGADGVGIDWVKDFLGQAGTELMKDADFGADGKFMGGRGMDVADHAFCREEEGAVGGERTVHRFGHAGADAAALRMQKQLDIGMLFENAGNVLRTDGLVHMAIAGIRDDVAALALARHYFRKKFVRKKKDGLFSGNGADDRG